MVAPRPQPDRPVHISAVEGGYKAEFSCMASPCEVVLHQADAEQARPALLAAAEEARRIERKFSRYRRGNILHTINQSAGRPVEVDGETARLLDYGQLCWELSEGLFDLSSGVLRMVWHFDGSDRVPRAEDVARVQKRVGWDRVHWQAPYFSMPSGMELDFGGIGKEYAVDRVCERLMERNLGPVLVNFGGDLRVSGRRIDGQPWRVGIDNGVGEQQGILALSEGALATSGDQRKFLYKDGRRYSHVLNPLSGWPVVGAPAAVTVAAPHCLEAGSLATLALLQGERAEEFLREQHAKYWLQPARD